MKTSRRGQQFIKDSEGLRLVAYLCPSGIWTIGWGHTSDAKYPVRKGMKITKAFAEVLFKHDMDEAEAAVDKYIVPKQNGNQYGALVSFVINVGGDGLRVSSLRRAINNGKDDVTREFSLWVKGGRPKRRIPGLVKRRADEAALYKTPDRLGSSPIKLPNTGKPTAQIEEGRNAKHDVSPTNDGTAAITTGTGTTGGAGVTEILRDQTDQLSFIAEYSQVIQYVVIAFVILGVGLTVYGLIQKLRDK